MSSRADAAPRLPRPWRRRAPRMSALDPVSLGVHAPAGRYVERDVDAALGAAVGAARVVLAHGPRLAGTTHALARTARLLLGDHVVVRPDPTAATDLPALVGAALEGLDGGGEGAGPGVVVWIDDAPLALLAGPDGLGGRLPDGARVLLTVREDLLHPDVAPDAAAGMRGVGAVVRVPGPLTADEAARSGPLGWGVDDVAGRRALDLAPVRDALFPSSDRDRAGAGAVRTAAVLRAATDWDRLAVPDPLSRAMLAHLAVGYARDLDPQGRAHSPEQLARTVDALATRRGSLLHRVRHGAARHHVPDRRLAVVADDAVGTADGWRAPDRLEEVLDTGLTGSALRRGVGVLALHRRFDALALRLLGDVEPGTVSAATGYGAGLAALETGRHEDARRWFGAVVDGGARGADADYRPRAAFWLGLDPHAPVDDRREHLALVVTEGPADDGADAAYMLAALERDAGRSDARRRWLTVAASAARDAGDVHRRADALVELAHLDWSTGAVDAARRGFVEVVDTGDRECAPEAMMALGTLAAEDGDDDTACGWYQRATAAGTDAPDLPHPRREDAAVRDPIEA